MSAAAETIPSETETSAPGSSESQAPETVETDVTTGITGGESTETSGDGEPDGISSAGGEPDKGSQEGGEDEGKTEDETQTEEEVEKDPVLDAVPEESTGYAEVEIPKGLEADDDMLKLYNDGAHAAGLTERQHKAVLDGLIKPALEHLNAKAEEGRLAMVAGWRTEHGTDKAMSTPEFRTQVAATRDWFVKNQPERAADLMGFLQATGQEHHPGLMSLFGEVGKLLGEGRMRPGSDPHGGGSVELTTEERTRRMFPLSVKD